MFNFTHVLNASTKQRYYIDRAELQNDEGYDESPDGGNMFQIDLQPDDINDVPIFNLSLYVSNNGRSAQITKNLNGAIIGKLNSNVIHEELQDAIIEGKSLIVVNQ